MKCEVRNGKREARRVKCEMGKGGWERARERKRELARVYVALECKRKWAFGVGGVAGSRGARKGIGGGGGDSGVDLSKEGGEDGRERRQSWRNGRLEAEARRLVGEGRRMDYGGWRVKDGCERLKAQEEEGLTKTWQRPGDQEGGRVSG